MTDVERLMALGADCIAGDIIWKHKVLGTIRNGVFGITPEGMDALLIEDVQVKEIVTTPKVKPKSLKAKPDPMELGAPTLESLLDAGELAE